MKSKKLAFLVLIVINLLFLNAFVYSGNASEPKPQAVGDYSLGFEIGDYFEFVCTEFNSIELNNVFGANWVSDLEYYMWWCGYIAPSALGQKTKFAIVNITDHPIYTDWWRFTYDGWGWIDKATTFPASPVVDDYGYNLPKNPLGELWNPSVWIIAKPVDVFLANVSYGMGYSTYDNIVNYTGIDVANYEVNWIYDENTAIVKNFVIKNDIGTVIYELWGFELKIEAHETYNWIVTELNTVELENVFGVNWESDLSYPYCWWALNAPSEEGNKSKLEIDTVLNYPGLDDWYRIYIDGWNWKDKELLHGSIPDRDDVWYGLPMDPTGVYWNPTVWLIATPVETFLEELSYYAGTSASGNIVTESNSDVESYEAIWTYDEDLGVTELFQIKNSVGTIIFEVILLDFIFQAGDTFEWEVTTLDAVKLEDVLGINWESDIQALFGTGCNQIGAKMKRNITDITLSGSLWYVYYDWWYWTTTSYSMEPDIAFLTTLYCDPEDGYWDSWMWFVPYPAYYYLVGRSYYANDLLSDLSVTRNATDIEDFQLKYIYDEYLCVFDTVQLLDDEHTIIFEYKLTDSLIITTPDSASSWEPSSSQHIYWTSEGFISDVKLELYLDDVFEMEIISSTPNDGDYLWTIPAALDDSTQYQIKISDVSNPTTYDYSDYFEIVTPIITILTPHSASSWETGTSQSINWTSKGSISNVKIELYLDDVFEMEIISSTPNDGEYLWTIPSELEDSTQYQIKISDVSNPSTYAFSDYFEITIPAAPEDFTLLIIILAIVGAAAIAVIITVVILKKRRSK